MQVIKKLIKFFLYLFGYFFHHNRKSKVLYYHDLGLKYTDMGTSMQVFMSHIHIIKKLGFEIVDQMSSPLNQVMIVFDDGWRGIYDNKDFFIKEEIHPTVFLAVSLIGKDGYLSEDQIRELILVGFYFESHTWSHTGLTNHHGQELVHELKGAKDELERLFGQPFNKICFPQGLYSNEVIEACRDAGYKLLFSSVWGGYYDELDRGLVRRVFMQDVRPFETKYILEGDSYIIRKRDYKHLYNK